MLPLRKSCVDDCIFNLTSSISYIPVHLEFALTELLKNAFRATVEHHQKQRSNRPLPPVIVTIAAPPTKSITPRPPFLSIRIRDEGGGVSPANLPFIFSYAFTTTGRDTEFGELEDEIGGGPYAAQHIGGSAAAGNDGGGCLFGELTGKGLQTGMGTLSGLGYGYVFSALSTLSLANYLDRLPLAKLYATYFGGDLQLVSLYNHGTDVFLKLRPLQKDDTSLIS